MVFFMVVSLESVDALARFVSLRATEWLGPRLFKRRAK